MGTTPKNDSKTEDKPLQQMGIKTVISHESDYEDFTDEE
jgi:hypothetical protein